MHLTNPPVLEYPSRGSLLCVEHHFAFWLLHASVGKLGIQGTEEFTRINQGKINAKFVITKTNMVNVSLMTTARAMKMKLIAQNQERHAG